MAHVRPISRARLTAVACIAVAIGAVGVVPGQLSAQETKHEDDQNLLADWDKMTDEQAVVATSHNVAAIMMAAISYSTAHGHKFPPISISNPNVAEAKQLSGLVLLLPYIGERPAGLPDETWLRYRVDVDGDTMRKAKELYRKIDLTRAWDDPANREAAQTIVPVFLAPKSAAIRDQRGFALSHFAYIRGYAGNDNGVFNQVGVRFSKVTDGTAKTLAIGQIHSELGPWLAAGPSTARYAYPPDASAGHPTFGSQFKPGWAAATADTTPWFVDTERADGKGLQLLVQRDDRTPISLDDYLYPVRPELELEKLMSFLNRNNSIFEKR